MTKFAYSDYVRHCLRFYVRHPHPTFVSDVDKLNWTAARDVVSELPEDQKTIVTELYMANEPMVTMLSKKHKKSPNYIWKLINEVERKVAKRRDLL